jgi:hypothetical protein
MLLDEQASNTHHGTDGIIRLVRSDGHLISTTINRLDRPNDDLQNGYGLLLLNGYLGEGGFDLRLIPDRNLAIAIAKIPMDFVFESLMPAKQEAG